MVSFGSGMSSGCCGMRSGSAIRQGICGFAPPKALAVARNATPGSIPQERGVSFGPRMDGTGSKGLLRAASRPRRRRNEFGVFARRP
jgi:hypothetical protein